MSASSHNNLRERAGLSSTAKSSTRVSDDLERETREMEERLKNLQASAKYEKKQLDAITKTDGAVWKNARATGGKFIDKVQVMADIEKKENFLRSQKAAAARGASSNSTSRMQPTQATQQQAAMPAPPQAAVLSLQQRQLQLLQQQQQLQAGDNQYSYRGLDSSRPAQDAQPWRLLAQPEWESEQQQAQRFKQLQVQQQQQSKTLNTQQQLREREQQLMNRRARSPPTKNSLLGADMMVPMPPAQARPDNNVPLARLAKMNSPVRGKVLYASEQPFQAALGGGSLLDGDFYEEANARAFQAARDAWKRGVPLQDEFSEQPRNQPNQSRAAEVKPVSQKPSVWDGEFDEAANASAFQAARDAWKKGQDYRDEQSESRTAAPAPSPAPAAVKKSSVWDGEFDEAANSRAFQAARDAWKKGVDYSDDQSEKQRSAPAPQMKQTSFFLSEQPKFAASESLLNGTFDEAGNRQAFQEARLAWLAAQKREVKKPAAQSDPAQWNVLTAQSEVEPDFLSETPYDDTTEFDLAKVAPSSNSTAMQSTTSTEKVGCYHCYKVFVRALGVMDEPTDKVFCTQKCLAEFSKSKIMCALPSCRRGLLRKDAVVAKRPGENRLGAYCCEQCSRGEQRPPSAPPAQSFFMGATTPLITPDIDEIDELSDDSMHETEPLPSVQQIPMPPSPEQEDRSATPIVEEPDDE